MFLPPSIDLNNPERYTLSIRITDLDFMFSISEVDNKKNYCLRSTKFEGGKESLFENIQKIIYDLNFLTLEYAQTNVIFISSEYTLVPAEYYDSKKKDTFFSFSPWQDDSCILTNELLQYGANTLFKMDEELYQFLHRSLCAPQFHHHTTTLIHLLEGRYKSTSLFSRFYVNLHEDYMDLFCFAGNKLLLTQTHRDLITSEQIYFILKVWESLEFDQMKDQLLIAGNLSEKVIDVLKEYIIHIERVPSPCEIFLWHEDAQLAPFDLISLSL